jgi:hypothetical protein
MGRRASDGQDISRVGPHFGTVTGSTPSAAFKLGDSRRPLYNLFLSGSGSVKLQRTPWGQDPTAHPSGAKPWYDCTKDDGTALIYTVDGTVSPSLVFAESEEEVWYRVVPVSGTVDWRVSG